MHFPEKTAEAVDLEILERIEPADAFDKGGVAKVQMVRINGQSVLVPRDRAIDITRAPTDCGYSIEVRLPLIVKNLRIGTARGDGQHADVDRPADRERKRPLTDHHDGIMINGDD